MSNIRQGYFSEQTRDDSFREVINDDEYLRNEQKIILANIGDGKTMQELSEITGKPVHLISARLNELRDDEYVITTGEKRKNPVTRKSNIIWFINKNKFNKELKLF